MGKIEKLHIFSIEIIFPDIKPFLFIISNKKRTRIDAKFIAIVCIELSWIKLSNIDSALNKEMIYIKHHVRSTIAGY